MMCYRKCLISLFSLIQWKLIKLIPIKFYKEDSSGETHNRIHNRVACTGQPLFTVLEEVNKEAIEAAQRVNTILSGRGVYQESWDESLRGYLAMHMTNDRYMFKDLGIGEDHPLDPFKDRISASFRKHSA
jgi:hypothetical protein